MTTRPLLLGIDGRSGSGKTSLAAEITVLLQPHVSVTLFHLDSIYPGWDGLLAALPVYVRDVVAPLAAGRPAHWTWWDWETDGPGRADRTRPADVVILEGVGAGTAGARQVLDALIWLKMPEPERQRRALARDGQTFAPHWDRWAAQERAYLEAEGTPSRADLTVDVAGFAHTHDTALALVEALRTLPAWASALTPLPQRSAAAPPSSGSPRGEDGSCTHPAISALQRGCQ